MLVPVQQIALDPGQLVGPGNVVGAGRGRLERRRRRRGRRRADLVGDVVGGDVVDVDVAGGDDVVQINADDPGRGRRAGLDTFQERQRRLQQMHIVCRAGGVQLFAQVGLQFLRAGIGRQHGDVDRGVAGRQARQKRGVRVAKRGSRAAGRAGSRAGCQRRDDQRDGVHAVAPPIHQTSEVAGYPQQAAATLCAGQLPDRRLPKSQRDGVAHRLRKSPDIRSG